MFTKSIVHTLHVLCLLYICTILCVCADLPRLSLDTGIQKLSGTVLLSSNSQEAEVTDCPGGFVNKHAVQNQLYSL